MVDVLSLTASVGLRKGALRETALPWALALVAYALMILVIVLDWQQQSWVALAHPVVNGLLGNGLVLYYAMASGKTRA